MLASKGPGHSTSSPLEGPKATSPNPAHTCLQGKAPQMEKPRSVFCSPAQPNTLMSGTPILVSGFLSSIFRIKSLSSSLTFGLKKRKEGDKGETADGPFLPNSSPYPGPGFPELTHGAVVKNPPANAGDARDAGLIPESGRSPGVRNGNPLQYSWKIPWTEEPGRL